MLIHKNCVCVCVFFFPSLFFSIVKKSDCAVFRFSLALIPIEPAKNVELQRHKQSNGNSARTILLDFQSIENRKRKLHSV